NIIVQVLQKGAGVFRAGTTTANFAFALPNVARDVSDMAVMTERSPVLGALNPAVLRDWARAWLDVARQSPDYLEFLDSGAAFSTFQKNVDEVHRYLRIGAQANPSKFASAGRVFALPLDAARWFNNTLEEATKLAAFREFRRQGLSPDEVAWRTRRFGGSPDFARRGRSMKTANMLLPFLNAQVQGVARLVPYLQKNPQHAAYVAAATLGQMALLQQYNNLFTDPDGTKSWKRISPREKEQNWVFFIPGTFTDPET